MRQVSLRVVFLMCVLLGAIAIPAYAQEATIVGTVTDPSGAAVPNATITITSTETGQVRQITSNSVGQYVVPDLRIGHYTVRVQAAGFKVTEHKDVALAVGDRLRMDFKLEIGTSQEQITVEASPIAVQADSGEVSDVITGQQITQLATNGRSLYSLAALTPGASSIMGDSQVAVPVGGDANVSFNGNRVAHNIYLIDGGENLDRGGAGTISVMPSIDAIAEFRTLSSNYSADYGLSSAGTLSMVFKSGTKDLHATLWEFLRNDKLDARNFFDPATKRERRLNVFGFNIGGPVTFGKLYNKDRDKTFFFYNMEWRRQVLGGALNQQVPLTSTYGGNFGSTTIYAPYTCQVNSSIASAFATAGQAMSGCTPDGNPDPTKQVAFKNNTIPSSLLDANAQALLNKKIFPAATTGNYFRGGNNAPTNVRDQIVRMDHRFSDKVSVFGHFVAESILQTYGTTMWSGDNVPSIGNTFGNPSYSGVIHFVQSISPSLVNETAFNYNGNRINILPIGTYDRSGVSIPKVFSGENALSRLPSIQLGGSTGTNYTANWVPWNNKADDYQIRDDISWVKGSHQIKIGASWAIYKKIQDLFANTQGGFNFNGFYTGNDFADFLLGYAASYNENSLKDFGRWDNVSWAAYVQDNWRVNRRLTLNLGLRWDGVPHTYEENNRGSGFYPFLWDASKKAVLSSSGSIDPSSPGLITSSNPALAGVKFYFNGMGIAGQNGVPEGMVDNHWAAFGPRVGFAYDLTGAGKTVVRGGAGVMYERVQGNDMYQSAGNPPFTSSLNLSNVYLSNPNKSIVTGATLSGPITINSISGWDKNDYKLPVSYQFSMGVQQQLGAKNVLELAYVGTQNRHQSNLKELNLPHPSLLASIINNGSLYNTLVPYQGFNSILIAANNQNAHYNSLQASLRGEVTQDLTLQVAYTLSKAVDPGNFEQDGGDLCRVSNPFDRSYDDGPSLFDRTHIFIANFVYKLPILKNSSDKVLKSVLGGWELSGIVTEETGVPQNVTLGGNAGGNGLPNSTNRPNLSGGISYPKTADSWFTGSFSAPALGQWGNTPKRNVRGPGRNNFNLSLFKSFTLNEARGSRFELRFEGFNVFNHTQFNGVSTSFTAGNFGKITSAFDARDIQIGAKLYF